MQRRKGTGGRRIAGGKKGGVEEPKGKREIKGKKEGKNTNEAIVRDWAKKLQMFIFSTLKVIIPDVERRKEYVNQDNMKYWIRAFTHESVSRTDNYENLEYKGDVVLAWAFKRYIMRLYKNENKAFYTEFNSSYQSKEPQIIASDKMGLSNYFRYDEQIKDVTKIKGDVFESFFGALETISDKLIDGTGAVMCYNMLVYLYKDFTFDSKKGKTPDKTRVIQIFSKFELPELTEYTPGISVNIKASDKLIKMLDNKDKYIDNDNIVAQSESSKQKIAVADANQNFVDMLESNNLVTTEINKSDMGGSVVFKIILKLKHIEFLEAHGINVADPVIGVGVAKIKKEAAKLAYTDALKTLAASGVTDEWAREVKLDLDLSHPKLKKYAAAAKQKIKEQGFDTMKFNVPAKSYGSKGTTLQLLGITIVGDRQKEVVLGSVYKEDLETDQKSSGGVLISARAQLLEDYINS